MTKEEIRNCLLNILSEIAPEADLTLIKPTINFRDQLDIDSMDFLNFIIAIHKKLNIDIPEKDYPQMTTLTSSVEYIATKRG